MTTVPGGTARGSERGLRRAASPTRVMVAMLVVASAALGSTLPTWITAQVHSSLNRASIEIAGSQAAPAVSSLALVAIVAAVALRIAGPKVRPIVCSIALLAAVGMGFSAVSTMVDPAAASLTELGRATGTEGLAADYTLSYWPWAAAFCTVLLLVISSWAAWVSRRWPDRRKYERNRQKNDQQDMDEIGTWDSLSRGIDPTK